MKALALSFFRKTLGVPILWLGLGVVAICASLGQSYLRAQVEADYALKIRVGPPEPVAIADAEPGVPGEGHVTARYDPERAVIVRIGPPGERFEWLAVPLFSAEGTVSPAAPAPRARPEPGDRALVRADGLAVFPLGSTGPEALIDGGGRFFDGTLNGPIVPLEAFALDTAAAFAEAGIALPAEFVAIRPWIQGRAAALQPPPEAPLSRYLLWAGILSILGSLALSLRTSDEGDRYLTVTPSEPERKIVTKSRILADQNRFNPLIGQDDIRRGAMERLHASERAQGRTPSTFFTNNAAKAGTGWVRNRR